MDLMRRCGLMSARMESEELYPVGTDLVTKYIGRNANGEGLFELGTYNNNTGEITIGSSDFGTSTIFMPVDPKYSYQKNGYNGSQGRLYFCGFYDEDYNYISYVRYNNLNIVDLPAFPSNARFIRIVTHTLRNNWGIAIVRTA